MADQYTHTFDFTVRSKFIRGEVEYNTDGAMSYKITQVSDPFSNDFLHMFQQFMEYFFILYNQEGDIKLIKVKRKE